MGGIAVAVSLTQLKGLARQRGVALITALLVVALATVAAVSMASRQQFDIRRTANLFDGDQSYSYALAVEAWARVILQRDAAEGERDYLDEDWAQRLSPIAIPGGQVDGYISDLQGRFNLNNLLTPEGQVSEEDLKYFQRLLDTLQIPVGVASAILDWIDPDFETRFPDGAEDEVYLSGPLPYRAANRPLQSISELRLIRGIDAEVWDKLAPYVCALPVRTALNVNTAEAPLLHALVEDFTAEDGQALVEARGAEGYVTVERFLQQELFAGRELSAAGLSVASQYFLIRASILVGTARTELYSVAQRNSAGVQIQARTQGTW